MILNKAIVEKIFEFVGYVRTENYYKFSNVGGYLTIFGMDSYSYFKLETQVKWDLSITEFNVHLPNLNFIENDLKITIDENYIYLAYEVNDNAIQIKLLMLEDDLYPSFDFNVPNHIDISDKYQEYKDLFKMLLRHTTLGSDDFTSCIYADTHNFFSTDKMSSCWYRTSEMLVDAEKILIDAKFIALFSRFDDFSEFSLVYSPNKIGFVVDYNRIGIKISYLTATVFLNYPDFKTIFERLDFIDSVTVDSKVLLDVLSSINKFDSKCDRIVLTFDSTLAKFNVREQSFDNAKFINLYVPVLDTTYNFEGNFEVILNPHLLTKAIQDMDKFTFWFNHVKKQPIMIVVEENPEIRKYIQVYHA